MTSYMCYAKERMNDPSLKKLPRLADVGKAIGVEWNQLDDQAKKKYEKISDVDKKRYQDQMLEFS